jgi:hypothetical protein
MEAKTITNTKEGQEKYTDVTEINMCYLHVVSSTSPKQTSLDVRFDAVDRGTISGL